MVQQRERLKSEHLKLTIEIFDKRYRIGDFNGQVLAEVSALKHIKPASSYLSAHQHTTHRVPGDRSHQKVSILLSNVFPNSNSIPIRTMWLRKSGTSISESTSRIRLAVGQNLSITTTTF